MSLDEEEPEYLGLSVRQHVDFSVTSEALDAGAIAVRLGIEPDTVGVRGSRWADPPRPARHKWEIRCDKAGMSVTEQLAVVLARLRPAESQLAALGSEPGCRLCLELVRYFVDEEGETPLEGFGVQHQLLGWILDADSVAFLARINASIWADEYG